MSNAVTLVRVEDVPEQVQPDGGVIPPHRIEYWSDGIKRVEYFFPPPPPDPRKDAAFKAQLIAATIKRPPRDDWAIRREHEDDLAVAYQEPAFQGLQGSLVGPLRNLLAARDKVGFEEARKDLARTANALTAMIWAEDLASEVVSPGGVAQLVEGLKSVVRDAPDYIREGWAEGVDATARPCDGTDLEGRYADAAVRGREYRPRGHGPIEAVLRSTAVPQPDNIDQDQRDRAVRRDWAHARTRHPLVTDSDALDHEAVGGSGLESVVLAETLDRLSPLQARVAVLLVGGWTQTEIAASLWPDTSLSTGQRRVSRVVETIRDALASDAER